MEVFYDKKLFDSVLLLVIIGYNGITNGMETIKNRRRMYQI